MCDERARALARAVACRAMGCPQSRPVAVLSCFEDKQRLWSIMTVVSVLLLAVLEASDPTSRLAPQPGPV
jgi:hypothetical protein